MRLIVPPGVAVPADIALEDLLDDLMDALNDLAAAGCAVTIRNGRLECDAGSVLPSPSGQWFTEPRVHT